MQFKFERASTALFISIVLLMGVGTYAQTAETQTKEEKKQAEQERKDRERKAKEDAKRQKQEDRAKAFLEKLVPVGKVIDYDRFKDLTTVNTKGMVVYPMDRDNSFESAYVGMWAVYSVQGQFGSSPPSVRLYLHGQTLLVGTSNNPCSLSMILNGTERVQFGEMKYGSNSILRLNIVWVDMSLRSFHTLVNSNSIEVQTCRFETTLNPRHIAGLATLLEGLPQATATTTTVASKAIVPLHPHIGTWKLPMMRDGVQEEWVLEIDGEPGALKGVLKMGKGGQVSLSNVISIGSSLSGRAQEFAKGGLNMVTISGQTSENFFKGTISFWLLGKQQPPIAFEGQRTSIP